MGQVAECIAAYRRQIELDPTAANAWRNLSDVKTFRFDTSDIQQMEAQLARPTPSAAERMSSMTSPSRTTPIVRRAYTE